MKRGPADYYLGFMYVLYIEVSVFCISRNYYGSWLCFCQEQQQVSHAYICIYSHMAKDNIGATVHKTDPPRGPFQLEVNLDETMDNQ